MIKIAGVSVVKVYVACDKHTKFGTKQHQVVYTLIPVPGHTMIELEIHALET